MHAMSSARMYVMWAMGRQACNGWWGGDPPLRSCLARSLAEEHAEGRAAGFLLPPETAAPALPSFSWWGPCTRTHQKYTLCTNEVYAEGGHDAVRMELVMD